MHSFSLASTLNLRYLIYAYVVHSPLWPMWSYFINYQTSLTRQEKFTHKFLRVLVLNKLGDIWIRIIFWIIQSIWWSESRVGRFSVRGGWWIEWRAEKITLTEIVKTFFYSVSYYFCAINFTAFYSRRKFWKCRFSEFFPQYLNI